MMASYSPCILLYSWLVFGLINLFFFLFFSSVFTLFFLEDHFNNKTKYWPESIIRLEPTTNTGGVCSSAVYQPERWGERTLTTTSVCCSPRGKTDGGTWLRPLSTVNGVWPRIFDNFEVLKFYQVLLSNITMMLLGTGSTGWDERGFRIDGCSSSQLQNKNKCKGFTPNIIEVAPPQSFQYWWEQLDQLDYGRTELITVFYC